MSRSSKAKSGGGYFDEEEEDEYVDSSDFDSSDSDSDDEDLSDEHTRLLYLVSLYNSKRAEEDDPDADDEGMNKNVWLRKVPLLVLVYEAVIAEVLDFDYAPAPDIVAGSRVYMNVSQEGRDHLDTLREAGFLYGLKLSSKKYQSTVALRITSLGEEFLEKKLTDEMREQVHKVAYPPGASPCEENLLKVTWDAEEGAFMLVNKNGYSRASTITDIEDVSYVSSPYLPASLRRWGRENKRNDGRVDDLKGAVNNIKDELDENITIDDVRILIGEWIPMGANQMVALNDKLGSSERVQGGFFTSVVDLNPDSSEFIGESEGLTEVDILDFDETAFVNFEAEVHFPEDEGIVQVEMFGVHIHCEGHLIYGMECEAVETSGGREKISLDNLSRLLVDVHVDSSKIIDNLISPHQRVMLDLTYLGDAERREKYNVILCSRIQSRGKERMPTAEEFLDRGENENEIKQVIGDTQASFQLSPDDEVFILGKNGMILCSKDVERFEPQIVAYLSLMTRNMFMRSLFQRTFILADTLKYIRELIEHFEADPNSVTTIRNLISEASGDIILLSEVQSYLAESLEEVEIPEPCDDKASKRLEKILHIESTQKRMVRRVNDMYKNIEGARGEVASLRSMADVVTEGKELKVQEAVQNNTKNLEDVFRANERASKSLEIMQVVLAGSLAFDCIDRLHGLYLGIASDVDWSVDAFKVVYETPGLLLLVNLFWWAVIGIFIQSLIKNLAEVARGVMSIRYKINQKVDWDAFEAFMLEMSPEVEDGDSDKNTNIKKFTWDEKDEALWQGRPPRIEVTMDARYHFLLKAFLQISTKKSKVSQAEAKLIFFRRLRDAGVLSGIVAGLEDEQDVEEWAEKQRRAQKENAKQRAARLLGDSYEVEEMKLKSAGFAKHHARSFKAKTDEEDDAR